MDVITIRIITQETTKLDECDALSPDGVPAEACDAPLGFIDMAKQVYSEGALADLRPNPTPNPNPNANPNPNPNPRANPNPSRSTR